MFRKWFPFNECDELKLFSNLKNSCGFLIGRKSLTGLRDFLSGVIAGAEMAGKPFEFKYNNGFRDWYWDNVEESGARGPFGYILEECGGDEAAAFDRFFAEFEEYLLTQHGIKLPVCDETAG